MRLASARHSFLPGGSMYRHVSVESDADRRDLLKTGHRSMMADVAFRPAATEQEVREGRRVHARAYAAAGYTDTCEDGLITDEWVPSSTYFVAVSRSSIVGVSRTIRTEDPASLPVLRLLEVDASWRRRLEALAGTQVVEVSALAVDEEMRKQSRAISAGLYRCMYQNSLGDTEQRWWLAMADVRLYRTLTSVFGLNLQPMGDAQFYKGSNCLPCALDLHASTLHKQVLSTDVLAWFTDGLEQEHWQVPQLADPKPS